MDYSEIIQIASDYWNMVGGGYWVCGGWLGLFRDYYKIIPGLLYDY